MNPKLYDSIREITIMICCSDCLCKTGITSPGFTMQLQCLSDETTIISRTMVCGQTQLLQVATLVTRACCMQHSCHFPDVPFLYSLFVYGCYMKNMTKTQAQTQFLSFVIS